MIIQTTRKDLFYNWLLYLDPILELSIPQRKILSALITLHYYHRHRYSDVNLLNETLFAEENLKSISKKLKINYNQFDNAFKTLIKKGIIDLTKQEDKTIYSISNYLIQYPRDSKFKLNFEFKIID